MLGHQLHFLDIPRICHMIWIFTFSYVLVFSRILSQHIWPFNWMKTYCFNVSCFHFKHLFFIFDYFEVTFIFKSIITSWYSTRLFYKRMYCNWQTEYVEKSLTKDLLKILWCRSESYLTHVLGFVNSKLQVIKFTYKLFQRKQLDIMWNLVG